MSDERRLRIGYALKPKKVQSFITPSLLNHAENQGIDLIQIDTAKPLIQQRPFDCIIHKLSTEEWKHQLTDFSSQNPKVIIIDPPAAIEPLHNRISMLQVVTEVKLSQENGPTVSIPKQVLIHDSELLSSDLNDLKFPVIAKPLVADGGANSHKMSLIFNNNGLKELDPPVILQEFVNHGGVIFKVYVAGKYVQCVKRSSLPDITEEKMGSLGDSMPFSQISNLGSSGYRVGDIEGAEMPLLSFVNEVADGLRQALGLRLFNFDMITDAENHLRYLVIDINYFPGYEKMPGYESVLTDFFKDIVNKNPSSVMAESQYSGCDSVSSELPS